MFKSFFVFLLSVAVATPLTTRCRCRPDEPCWPSQNEWSALNDTIHGNLVAVRPVASVCHGDEYNAQACKAVTGLSTNSVWRSAQPGAAQYKNWEAWPEQNQTCFVESSRSTTCGQGRVSLYSAKVQTASQVQEAVRFAHIHNIRLVIKNTGHDFLGRSTAPESLQILTHGMKDIQVMDNFVPRGALKGNGEGHAMTLAAGVQLPAMYAAAAKHNRTVVGGAAHTVGAAGGYIQAGGHSPFGAWGGLGSDNALEFEVVTANGTLVHANAWQNPDLFWALRGGGGGTFGIVTSVTLRTFPEVPVVGYNLNFTAAQGSPEFWEAWSEFHAALPSLNDAGGSGYYWTSPDFPLNADTSVSAFISFLMFPGKTDVAEIDEVYRPLMSKLEKLPGVGVQNASIPFPTMNSTIFNLLLAGSNADSTGTIVMLGSRLFSRKLLTSKDGADRFTNAWKRIKMGPYDAIAGHVVGGGAVAANGAKIDSAVNPAWRETITHMVYSRGWAANATLAQQAAIIKNMTEVEIPILRSVEGADQMGAYMNEANGYEVGFQQSFWGDNYPRLYRIKQKWDPSGVFISRKGVGSEDWDDAGLCMIVRNPNALGH